MGDDTDTGGERRAEHEAVTRLKRSLPGFDAAPDDRFGFARAFGRRSHRYSVDHEAFPIPAIPRLTLILLGCHDLGRGEKLAWEHPFQVDGVPCSLALEKFGLRLYVETATLSEDRAAELAERILGRLQGAQRIVDRDFLRPYGDEQVKAGRVTVANRCYQLRETYQYFREGADLAFAGKGRFLRESPGGGAYLWPERPGRLAQHVRHDHSLHEPSRAHPRIVPSVYWIRPRQ